MEHIYINIEDPYSFLVFSWHCEMNNLFDFFEDETSRKLAVTLSQLLETETMDQITSSRIIKQSGVSRSTYYRRYIDKYDLLNRLYQRLLDDTIMKVPDGFPFRKAFFNLYRTLQTFPVFFRNALASREPTSLRFYIFDRGYEMYDRIMRNAGLDMDSDYYKLLLTGYLHGTLEITCIWADRGMKEDVELVYRITCNLMPGEMQKLMAPHL